MLLYGNLQTMRTDKWACSKYTQTSTKVWVILLLLPENALNSILRPSNYVNWKFEPSPSTTHTLTPPPIHTQNRSKNYAWIYRGIHWGQRYWSKLNVTLRNKDLATSCGFKRKIPHTLSKTHWSRVQFQSLATKILPLTVPGLRPTVQNSS